MFISQCIFLQRTIMNYILKHWTVDDKIESLLFFAQRMLELSYNKSDFKEKNLKISTLDLIDELLNAIEFQTEKGEDGISHDFRYFFLSLTIILSQMMLLKKYLGIKKIFILPI